MTDTLRKQMEYTMTMPIRVTDIGEGREVGLCINDKLWGKCGDELGNEYWLELTDFPKDIFALVIYLIRSLGDKSPHGDSA